MSEAQAEALDMVHFVAEKKALSLKLQRGDIQLFNNLAVLHARHAFSDDDKESSHRHAPRSKRHLVRLWLRNENRAWKLPESLAVYWFEVFGKSERMAKRRYEYDAKEETEHIITRKMTC